MHAWNPEFVKANYPRHIERWSKDGPDGTLWIEPAIPPVGFGKELSNARDLGWAAACASEVGDADTLQRLLAYADQFLNPVWQDGAYFYQRRDGWFDQQGRLSAMDPHTGNALLAYARLNVPDGLRKLYSKPWDESHFREPALVDMPDDLDVCGAQYDADSASLWLNLRAGGGPRECRQNRHRQRVGPWRLDPATRWRDRRARNRHAPRASERHRDAP